MQTHGGLCMSRMKTTWESESHVSRPKQLSELRNLHSQNDMWMFHTLSSVPHIIKYTGIIRAWKSYISHTVHFTDTLKIWIPLKTSEINTKLESQPRLPNLQLILSQIWINIWLTH